MDAKLFRDFIDYMEDEEISDVDTLILDNANNTINLNGEKYNLEQYVYDTSIKNGSILILC